ncbi:MAG: hypothetical protein M3O90_08880, partial [Actinomycetota bacterium]|nr:hypothetical protein [Actinomycetota bacterium]
PTTTRPRLDECANGHTQAVKRGVLIIFVALAASLLGRGTANAVPATTHAVLRLMDAETVTFRGTGFKARERVRVIVTAKTRAAKSVIASPGGIFVVHFARMDASSCVGFIARAVGSDGSRASFKRAPGQCAVP